MGVPRRMGGTSSPHQSKANLLGPLKSMADPTDSLRPAPAFGAPSVRFRRAPSVIPPSAPDRKKMATVGGRRAGFFRPGLEREGSGHDSMQSRKKSSGKKKWAPSRREPP
jgi:hypothetical protein